MVVFIPWPCLVCMLHGSVCFLDDSSVLSACTVVVYCISSTYFSEARRQGFAQGTPVSSPTSWVNGSANKIKLK